MKADQLHALPDDGYRHELEAGLLVAEPLPMYPHGRVQARLITIIGEFVERHGLGVVVGEIGYVLARDPDTVRGPDVSFISSGRVGAVGDGMGFVDGAPDLAIELPSPSNDPAEIHGKVADYLAAGSRLVWVIDPQTRTVTTYRSLLAPRRLDAEALLEGEDVIPGFSISVDAIFGG